MAKSKKKILIAGGSGFVGYHLCSCLMNSYEIYGTYCFHPFTIDGCTLIKLDITNHSDTSYTIQRINPSIIIHTAALSSPDTYEKNSSMATTINIEGTYNVVGAAKKYGNRVVYVSTDMVFDGEKGNYSEYDTPQPVNLYGKSKLHGENICLQASVDSVIVRITLQYGWGNHVSVSFSDWIIGKLREGKQANLFTDQYRTPTYIFDTIKGLEIAALHAKSNTLYHLAAPEKADRYSFDLVLAYIFNLPKELFKKSLMSDVKSPDPRPREISLNGQKFLNHFKFQPRSIYEGLKTMAREKSNGK